jgi:lambda family phage portal protein
MFGRLTRAIGAAVRSYQRDGSGWYPWSGQGGWSSLGGFDAAGRGDRWPRSSLIFAPASQQLGARLPIARRAGWLIANSPSAASFVNTWVTSLVSTGPIARSMHPDQATRKLLEKAWGRFVDHADAEGRGDLTAFLTKAVRNLVAFGESFVQMPIVERRLKLKLIASEQVDTNWTRQIEDGRAIFSGVEVYANGKVLAYWTLRYQTDLPWLPMVYPPDRISGDDMLHVFDPPTPGSVRGLSWLSPVATRLLELDRLEDALLARANTSALFCGFIRDVDNTAGFQTGQTTRDGRPELSMEPVALRVLPPGCEVQFPANMPDTAGASDFLKHILRTIAAGGGVPASLLTGDLSDVNYSSARMGIQQFKRSCSRIQQTQLVAQLHMGALRLDRSPFRPARRARLRGHHRAL